MNGKRKKRRETGQVLIFAVVILIILLIAAVFLFDLHSIIRAKIKLDTAEQAAALAAGRWQMRSLNLIGEINLIKAADTLLSDDVIPTVGDDDAAKIASADKTLTEMQSRISFCGPLIAFGAAQQAAKNNGINTYASDSSGDLKTVYSDLNNYLDKLDPSSEYYNYGDIAEYLNYYKWREPYVAMLKLILSQGLAVRPNGRFPGIESVDPPWLDDETLYSAILNKTWCNPNLNAIVKYIDSYWNGKWWNVDFEHTSFPEESEIYTLGVKFTGSVTQATLEKALEETLSTARLERLQSINWCAYDSKWPRYAADGTSENLNYSGPNNDGLNYWSRGMFLYSDLNKSMFYGGATAYAECYQYIRLMSKYKSRMSRPAAAEGTSGAADQLARAREALRNDLIRTTSEETLKVGNDSSADTDSGGAVAKPLGALSDGSPPPDAVIILPVFTNVAMIPSTMQRCRPLRVEFSDLEKFLIWLSEVDDLANPGTAPPEGTQSYLTALQTLADPTFRKSGWNNDYTAAALNVSAYFGDDYKYDPETNPSGAGWLQQIWVGTDSSVEESASSAITEKSAGWNTRIYSGKKYILRDSSGNLVTNEQMICRWTPGGSGGTVSGTRIGPSRL
ncbi:MAG: pilus assembly protein TadG-related protein [Victivallaceae bacterium]|nr:pilus assembly protein TadG-related protein [Victivallaceae bacterium]